MPFSLVGKGLRSRGCQPQRSISLHVTPAFWESILLGAGVCIWSSAQAKTYQVKNGDSLWTIARKFDTHVDLLCKHNHLSRKSTLQLGQVLVIPEDTEGKPTSPPPVSSQPKVKQYGSGYINDSRVNMRCKPDISSQRVCLLDKGVPVRVIEKSPSGWLKVQLASNEQGWVRGDFVSLRAAPRAASDAKPSPGLPSRIVRINRRAYIGKTDVNVRSTPGIHAPRVAKASKGTPVQLVAKCDDWYKVKFPNGRRGWVLESLISEGGSSRHVAASLGRGPRAYARGDDVNIRRGPGREHDRIAQVDAGTPMRICAKRGDWYKVRCPNGTTGWIAGFLVKVATTSVRRSYRVTQKFHPKVQFREVNVREGLHPFVRSALRYQGTPYVRGSSYPSRGFDCSGLVYRVLHSNGVNAPRTARDQFRVGTPVSRDELKPGDLVFFKNTYRRGVSHVGIYVGNGKFVHSSSSRRHRGVTVTPLDSSYYARKYAGARRIE